MCYWWTCFRKVPEITAPELMDLANKMDRRLAEPKPKIIDVRSYEEYQFGHVKHSVHAPYEPASSFGSRIEPVVKALPRNTPIVVVSMSSHRSIGAYKWLKSKGYSNVRKLKKGMEYWRQRGLPEQKSR